MSFAKALQAITQTATESDIEIYFGTRRREFERHLYECYRLKFKLYGTRSVCASTSLRDRLSLSITSSILTLSYTILLTFAIRISYNVSRILSQYSANFSRWLQHYVFYHAANNMIYIV